MSNKLSFLRHKVPTILTCIGAVGTVATSVLAVKATPKAMKLLDAATYEKGSDLTVLEKIKVAGGCYIPSAMVCAATLCCIFGANALNKKQQASLISAYAMLDKAYRNYRGKVRETLGPDTDEQILKAIVEEQIDEGYVPGDARLCYDMQSGDYFEASVEVVTLDDGLECYIIDPSPEY